MNLHFNDIVSWTSWLSWPWLQLQNILYTETCCFHAYDGGREGRGWCIAWPSFLLESSVVIGYWRPPNQPINVSSSHPIGSNLADGLTRLLIQTSHLHPLPAHGRPQASCLETPITFVGGLQARGGETNSDQAHYEPSPGQLPGAYGRHRSNESNSQREHCLGYGAAASWRSQHQP